MAPAPNSPRPERWRVFFALWPEGEVARQLADIGHQAQAQQGGRTMARATLHLTLAFIGGVTPEEMPKLQAVAEAVVVELTAAGHCLDFDLVLDKLAAWQHKHIVWLGSSQLPPALPALAEALHRRLTEAGYTLEARPFAAHITLLRNAACGTPLIQPQPVLWSNRGDHGGFVLVRSCPDAGGAHYRILSRHG